MNQYKNIDLKVDLMLLNQDTAQEFINKYKDNIKKLIQCIRVLIYLDDFMYIDVVFKEKLIFIKELLKKNNIQFDEETFESDIVELDKRIEEKSPRGKTAMIDYYSDLNKYIDNNDVDFDRLTDICESVRIMDNFYSQKKGVDNSSNKVILFLTDIKYKIELFNIQNNLRDLMKLQKTKKCNELLKILKKYDMI